MGTADDLGRQLRRAARKGEAAEVVRLLRSGARPDSPDSAGRTALHEAAFQRSASTVGVLLDAGADPSCRDASGWTPLFVAACRGAAGVVQALLSAGASVDVVDAQGETPLHAALSCCWEAIEEQVAETVEVLLAAGANPTAANRRQAHWWLYS